MFKRYLCHYCLNNWAEPHSAFCSTCLLHLRSECYDFSYQRCPICYLPLLHDDAHHTCQPGPPRYLLFPAYSDCAYYLNTLNKVPPRRVCRFFAQLALESLPMQRCFPVALPTSQFSRYLVKEMFQSRGKAEKRGALALPEGSLLSRSLQEAQAIALVVALYREREVAPYLQTLAAEKSQLPYVVIALSEGVTSFN